MTFKRNRRPIGAKQLSPTGYQNVLSSIYNGIVNSILRDPVRDYPMILDRYIKDARNVPKNNRDVSSAKGNIRKELERKQMSWKVFGKGMMVLKVRQMDLRLVITHNNYVQTVHDYTLKFDQDTIDYLTGDSNDE